MNYSLASNELLKIFLSAIPERSHLRHGEMINMEPVN